MNLCIQDHKLEQMPKVLAFQSAADATVSTSALVSQLFARLPENKHELVLFDINRAFDQESLISHDPLKPIQGIIDEPDLTFTCSVITNETGELLKTVLEKRIPGMADPVRTPLSYLWHNGQYSLSHVALPFSEQDALYGSQKPDGGSVIHLGGLSLKGERNLIRVPASEIIRLRWNPFYGFLKERVSEFVE